MFWRNDTPAGIPLYEYMCGTCALCMTALRPETLVAAATSHALHMHGQPTVAVPELARKVI